MKPKKSKKCVSHFIPLVVLFAFENKYIHNVYKIVKWIGLLNPKTDSCFY